MNDSNKDKVLIGLEHFYKEPSSSPVKSTNLESSVQTAVRDLIATYHSLNSSQITPIHEEPSPLNFMRYVARNRPFVIRNGAKDWKARKLWNADYLTSIMSGQNVNVAITADGNADSVVSKSSGELLFVKPYETEQPFSTVLEAVRKQEMDETYDGPTHYAQTQNDNLRSEYVSLLAHIPKSIPFARIALEKEPDAVNFWLGNSHSVTALHKDNYENIYVQILGQKHFVLLPPVEAPCVGERKLRTATYTLREPDDNLKKDDLYVRIDEPEEYVPFATWDPDMPKKNTTIFSELSQPMRVTLNEGDMLYLPALWYHKVSQSCNNEGLCCAVNYWYDMDFDGGFWSTANFVRSVGLLTTQDQQSCEIDDMEGRKLL